MLAEPRRRQKNSVDPQGLNWANDQSKFGQRMLERMGWQNGRGLGRNEDGTSEIVKIAQKSDNRGVGCTKADGDKWIAHQDDFSELLSNLNSSYGVDGEAKNSELGVNGAIANAVNLVEKSKGRVHYTKFAKSKDLSSCKVDDFNSIFGIRKSTTRDLKAKPNRCQASSSDEEVRSEFGTNAAAEPRMEQSHGLRTSVSLSSVGEYFAAKMAAKKSTLSVAVNGEQETNNIKNSKEIITEVNMTKVTSKRKRMKKSEDETIQATSVEVCELAKIDGEKVKKRKKRKMEKGTSIEVEESNSADNISADEKKAKKKLGNKVEVMTSEDSSPKRIAKRKKKDLKNY